MQKCANLEDLVKSFQTSTSIYLQNLASIQPRASQSLPKVRKEDRKSIGRRRFARALLSVHRADVDAGRAQKGAEFRHQYRQGA